MFTAIRPTAFVIYDNRGLVSEHSLHLFYFIFQGHMLRTLNGDMDSFQTNRGGHSRSHSYYGCLHTSLVCPVCLVAWLCSKQRFLHKNYDLKLYIEIILTVLVLLFNDSVQFDVIFAFVQRLMIISSVTLHSSHLLCAPCWGLWWWDSTDVILRLWLKVCLYSRGLYEIAMVHKEQVWRITVYVQVYSLSFCFLIDCNFWLEMVSNTCFRPCFLCEQQS